MVIHVGKMAYIGPVSMSMKYMSSIGYNCPKYYNLADFMSM
jgi:hypothetical protein